MGLKSRRNIWGSAEGQRQAVGHGPSSSRVGRTQPLGRGRCEALTDKPLRMLTVTASLRKGQHVHVREHVHEQRGINVGEHIEGEECWVTERDNAKERFP